MGIANYFVKGNAGHWVVEHDGAPEGDYDTKEAAFEAALAAASLACREGHEVHVSVPSSEVGGSTTGAALV
jgi:hypothetical protein